MSSCTRCHGPGVRHTSATCPILKRESLAAQSNAELDEQLNFLWDCFHPFNKAKTLDKWRTLVQAREQQAYERGRIDEAKTCEKAVRHDNKKAQRQLLQELMEQMPDDSIVATKYGYHSREKKYGFRMGVHEAKSVIQNKLEGLS